MVSRYTRDHVRSNGCLAAPPPTRFFEFVLLKTQDPRLFSENPNTSPEDVQQAGGELQRYGQSIAGRLYVCSCCRGHCHGV